MKRLFFALWPDNTTRQHCAEVIASLCFTHAENVVTLSNLHVTLVFLGNVAAVEENLLIQATSNLQIPELRLCFDHLSFWQKPGIMCLRTSHQQEQLLTLVDDLQTVAKNLNISIDDRPYLAHITLARKVKQSMLLDFEPIELNANSLCLVQSCSLPGGVEYRVLHEWKAISN